MPSLQIRKLKHRVGEALIAGRWLRLNSNLHFLVYIPMWLVHIVCAWYILDE